MNDEQKQLLGHLLTTPTQSYQEDALAGFLAGYAVANGWRVQVDPFKNVIVTKGHAEAYPMMAAHIDSVHPVKRKISLKWEGDTVFGVDAKGNRAGCGADCKTGVYVALQIMHLFPVMKLGFFAGEEMGCAGARAIAPELMADVGYVVEWDCPSSRMMSYTSSGVRLFADRGEFIETALPVLDTHKIRWQRHPYTDVSVLAPRFDLSCLNLSSGYHNWHMSNEYAVLSEMDDAVNIGAHLVINLGSKSYPLNLEPEETEPLREVTGLVCP